jgi:WD40 repeat protein
LERKLPAGTRLALEPMVASEGASLLDSWLAESGRTLQPDQRSFVLDRFAGEGRPLFLKLAFDYALHWPSFKAGKTIALGTDIAGLLNGLFDRLSADSNHGPTIVSRSLGFLAAAKNGLSEDELLDVLSRDEAVYADFIERAHHEPPEKRLPVVVWSRLYFDLESHLAERNADGISLFTFYHRQFGEAAHARFLSGDAKAKRHRELAGYFADLPLFPEKGRETAPHLRKLAELPFQQIHGGLWKDIPGTLADFGFLQAKVEAGYLDDAIGDFETLKREFPAPESPSKDSFRELRTLLTAFSSAFNQEFHFFRDSPRTTAQQLYSNLYAHEAFDGPVGAVLKTYYERGSNRDGRPWLRRLNRAPRTSPSRDLLRTIAAHEDAVTALAVSPAGDFLATGSVDGTLRVWKERDGTQQAGFSAHAGGVTALRFIPGSPDSSLLASGGRDGFIRIWDWRTEVQVSAWKAHGGRVRCLLALGDGDRLASCGDDPVIKLWSRATGAQIKELRGHKDRVFGLAGNPTGTLILSGGEDRTLKHWLLDRPGEPKTLRGHERAIRSVGLGTDLKWAASGSDDGCLKTWGLETGSKRHSVEAHRRRLNDIAIGPATGRIATAGEDATVKIWDAGTLGLLNTFLGHSGAVQSLAFGPQEAWLASAGADGSLRLWDLGGGRKKDDVSWEHEGSILGIGFDEGRGIVATVGEDTTVRIWSQRQGDHQTTLRGHLGPVYTVLPLKKDILVSASGDRTIKIWEISSSRLVRTLGQPLSGAMAAVTSAGGAIPFSTDMKGGHSGPVTCLGRISDDLVISGSRDGTLRMWEVAEGKEVRIFEGKTGPVEALAVDPDRRMVISAGTSHDLLVWDLDANKVRAVWKRHSGNVTCLAMPPGSSHVISGSLDRSVGVWSLADGECRMLPGHKDRVNAVAFDPGRGLIASAGQDASVRLWDAGSGEDLGTLAGHRAPVRAVFLDAGAGLVISGGDDGYVNVWQIDGGRPLARIGLSAPVTAVRSLPELTIIAGMKNGGVAFLKLENRASVPDGLPPSPAADI